MKRPTNYLTVLELRSPNGPARLHSFCRLPGRIRFLASPASRGCWNSLACGPFRHRPNLCFPATSPAGPVVTLPPSQKETYDETGPTQQSRRLRISRPLTSSQPQVLLPRVATKSQVPRTRVWHLWEAAILSPQLPAEVVPGVCEDAGARTSSVGNMGTGGRSGGAATRSSVEDSTATPSCRRQRA